MNGGAITRCIGRAIMACMGYKIEGRFANEPKMIIIGAPHTSNWDLLLAIGIMLSLGVRINFMMKKEAFFFPFKTLFLSLGGVAIDRSQPKQVVLDALAAFNTRDKFWMAILPEGTRSAVLKWKSGFIRIADSAAVPVFIIGVDSRTKTLHLDRLATSNETAEDLRLYCKGKFYGLNPKNN